MGLAEDTRPPTHLKVQALRGGSPQAGDRVCPSYLGAAQARSTVFRGRLERETAMWRRIEVRNYRSIEKVSVDLAPFTVVVGPNASGKSNFADVLVFARDIANDASTAVQSRGGIAGVR